MQYKMQLISTTSSSSIDPVGTVERKLPKEYSTSSLADALLEFLRKVASDARKIVSVSIVSTGTYLIESTVPLAEYLDAMRAMLRAKFHTYVDVRLDPVPV